MGKKSKAKRAADKEASGERAKQRDPAKKPHVRPAQQARGSAPLVLSEKRRRVLCEMLEDRGYDRVVNDYVRSIDQEEEDEDLAGDDLGDGGGREDVSSGSKKRRSGAAAAAAQRDLGDDSDDKDAGSPDARRGASAKRKHATVAKSIRMVYIAAAWRVPREGRGDRGEYSVDFGPPDLCVVDMRDTCQKTIGAISKAIESDPGRPTEGLIVIHEKVPHARRLEAVTEQLMDAGIDRVEHFAYDDFLINKTKNALVPRHVLIPGDSDMAMDVFEALCANRFFVAFFTPLLLPTCARALSLSPSRSGGDPWCLPAIHEDDPIAKYYGARVGDLFRIDRAGQLPAVRIVCAV
jgi:DNA-directed RNA polymerase subunit H (RpoH/RPB5)